MLKECEPPGFLVGKLYGNLEDESKYIESFKNLLNSIGVVFNKNAMSDDYFPNNLGTAIDKAASYSLPLMARFHRPFQYIGISMSRGRKGGRGQSE